MQRRGEKKISDGECRHRAPALRKIGPPVRKIEIKIRIQKIEDKHDSMGRCPKKEREKINSIICNVDKKRENKAM